MLVSRARTSTTSTFIENIDHFPTLMDMAGLAVPEFMEGKSFKDTVLQGTPGPREGCYAEIGGFGSRRTAYRNKDLLYVMEEFDDGSPETGEFYLLADDPGEMTNLYDHPDYQEQITGMREQVLA